jgi:BA14K-like protein
MHKMTAAALGAAFLGSVAAGAATPAVAAEGFTPQLAQAYPGESYAQYRRYGRPYYGRGYYRRGYGGGAAAAGVLGGLAAGAIIGGAIANQGPLPKTQDPDFIAYCSRKYRSFDPIDGTFLARDGLRYECEYP